LRFIKLWNTGIVTPVKVLLMSYYELPITDLIKHQMLQRSVQETM